MVGAACASAPEAPPLSADPELDAFARQVERHLEEHAWQELLAVSDPDHYRVQVVEHGMPEPQYVAELFGLHSVGNSIERGATLAWADLERIGSVELHEMERSGDAHRLTGTVSLDDGGTLELQARIRRTDGRYVLTGGVG